MIQYTREIQINTPTHVVFDIIDKMPNKFPLHKFLETKPLFFLRILRVDGLDSAWEGARTKRPANTLKLFAGDTMWLFTLIELERPEKYWFSLKSLFFDCQTGYFPYAKATELNLFRF